MCLERGSYRVDMEYPLKKRPENEAAVKEALTKKMGDLMKVLFVNQAEQLLNWDGKNTLLLYPQGGVEMQSFKEMAINKWQSEEFECAMKVLDDLGIPTQDSEGEKFSLVGRIMALNNSSQNSTLLN